MRTNKILVGACLALGGVVQASAVSLFTTSNDFLGWSATASQLVVVASPTADLDGATTNGLGNTTTPAAIGAAGGLSVTHVSGTYDNLLSAGEQTNSDFLAALGTAGNLLIDYTTPGGEPASGGYFELRLLINYSGGYLQIDPTTTSTVGSVTTASYDYTLSPGAYSYFQMGVIYNSNYTGGTFSLDNVRTGTPVPEPVSMCVVAVGVVGLLARRRRKA